ncbi:SCO2522 family protein [Cryptosporangium minutisporangium]|uniref:SCO2522 family protein n=1 Tax=Cryptosporangium minutisporangium TaxID=113569 RepID=A0ABP6T2B2_9ACTN
MTASLTPASAPRPVPLSHLSVELAHVSLEDFKADQTVLVSHFQAVRPWVEAAIQTYAPVRIRPRISTCVLVDDYFNRFDSPADVLPAVLDAARAAGLTVDYLARTSGCVRADGLELAALVLDRLVPDPPPGTDGSRPPMTESGWLSNGQRSPADVGQAMSAAPQWSPPVQNSARRDSVFVDHSIFVDIELWESEGERRIWSRSFLAAVWQLVRLGLLRYGDEAVMEPRAFDGAWPDDWDVLPPLLRLDPHAAPFCAIRTFSVRANRWLEVDHAVRTILDQVSIDERVLALALAGSARLAGEALWLPERIVDWVSYAHIGYVDGPA